MPEKIKLPILRGKPLTNTAMIQNPTTLEQLKEFCSGFSFTDSLIMISCGFLLIIILYVLQKKHPVKWWHYVILPVSAILTWTGTAVWSIAALDPSNPIASATVSLEGPWYLWLLIIGKLVAIYCQIACTLRMLTRLVDPGNQHKGGKFVKIHFILTLFTFACALVLSFMKPDSGTVGLIIFIAIQAAFFLTALSMCRKNSRAVNIIPYFFTFILTAVPYMMDVSLNPALFAFVVIVIFILKQKFDCTVYMSDDGNYFMDGTRYYKRLDDDSWERIKDTNLIPIRSKLEMSSKKNPAELVRKW